MWESVSNHCSQVPACSTTVSKGSDIPSGTLFSSRESLHKSKSSSVSCLRAPSWVTNVGNDLHRQKRPSCPRLSVEMWTDPGTLPLESQCHDIPRRPVHAYTVGSTDTHGCGWSFSNDDLTRTGNRSWKPQSMCHLFLCALPPSPGSRTFQSCLPRSLWETKAEHAVPLIPCLFWRPQTASWQRQYEHLCWEQGTPASPHC